MIFENSLLQNSMRAFKINKTCFSLRLNISHEFPDPVGSIASLLFIQILEKDVYMATHRATVKHHIIADKTLVNTNHVIIFSDHVLIIELLRVQISNGSFNILVILIVE